MNTNTSTLPPPVAMLQLITGYWVSRAVFVFAKLGIADRLAAGRRTSRETSGSIRAACTASSACSRGPASSRATARAAFGSHRWARRCDRKCRIVFHIDTEQAKGVQFGWRPGPLIKRRSYCLQRHGCYWRLGEIPQQAIGGN